MSEDTTGHQPGEERHGDRHSVTRRIVSRRIIEFPRGEDVDFGQPTSEKDMVELQTLAGHEAEDFIRNSPNTEHLVNEATLHDIASHVNRKFMFHNSRDVGIGTIPKQLENYRTSSKEELPDKLDCKLVTVMTGLVTQQVGRKWEIDTKLFLASRGSQMTPHPSVIIEVPGNQTNENVLFVDFHTKLETDESDFTARVLDEHAQKAHGSDYKTPLDMRSLKELDEVFLRA